MKSENKNKLCRSAPAPKTGIVHLGLGAFFERTVRYTLRKPWRSRAATGVWWASHCRSPGVRDKLVKQGCLYTALELSSQGLKSQVVDVVTSVLFAPEDPNAVLREMVAETTRIVSLTITEKGYCRGGGDTALDFDHPDIKHDLQTPHQNPLRVFYCALWK